MINKEKLYYELWVTIKCKYTDYPMTGIQALTLTYRGKTNAIDLGKLSGAIFR